MKTILDYAELIKKEHALDKTIAPVENGATFTGSYTSGKQFIRDGVLYTALTTIAASTAWNSLTLDTDYEVADDLITQIAGIETGLSNEAATRSALGAKNRLPITLDSLKQTATAGTWNNNVYSENGIDFTVNTNSSGYVTSIVVSGTASAVASINLLGTGITYATNDFAGMILTGCPIGGGDSNYRTVVFIGDNQDGTGHTTQYEDGTGVTIGTNAYVRIYLRIASGTDLTTPITFYPMIRLASDADPTFQPYSETNVELTDEVSSLKSAFANNVNQNGCKNLYPSHPVGYKLTSAQVTATWEENGVVDVDGTSSGYAIFTEYASKTIDGCIDGQQYVLSGCPSGGATNKYLIYVYDLTAGAYAAQDIGNGAIFTYHSDHVYNVAMYVTNGTAVSHLKFKPMLCLKSDYDLDPTYEPYSKTNRQLTEDSVTWDNLSEVGAVNYAPCTATSQTITRGTDVTFVVNDDGSITENSSAAITDNIDLVTGELTLKKGCTYRVSDTKDGKKYNSVSNSVFVRQKSNGTWLFSTKYLTTLSDVYTPSEDVIVQIGIQITPDEGAISNKTIYPMVCPVSYNGPYVPYAKTNKELTDDVTSLVSGVPNKIISRFAGGSTTITVKIPLAKASQYCQGSLKLISSNGDRECHVTFACNNNNTSVVYSNLKNVGTDGLLTLDSITTDGTEITIVIGGGVAYSWFSAEYFISMSNIADEQPKWNFA